VNRLNNRWMRLAAALAVLLSLCVACRGGTSGRPTVSTPPANGAPSSAATHVVPTPPATGDYATAVRAATRHGLRVWLEADLVKRWLAGPTSFDAALTQLASLASIRGVVGIKIADELGYQDGLSSTTKIKSFLSAASAGLRRVAPGKQLLVDMIVPMLGCLPDHQPPLLWSTECTVKTGGQYPQLSLDSVTSYLQMNAFSVLDLSTGLLPDTTYVGWGVDRDIAQNAAWAKVKSLGWTNLVTVHARKALAHPGSLTEASSAASADVHTWVDLPLRDGAAAVDIWTWRQMYQGSMNRILNPGLQPNALWTALQARRAKGDTLFTHMSPHSLEVGLDEDLTVMSKVFTDVFVAAGTG
jgi:hypothetical protein